ncbi:MAG: hypothetical protein J2P40_04210 [Candidatus Dormibacteraeota bacterium]|nr:hypothetical protein [Candidatus Dormibacteraeota bacterium]
MAEWNHEGGDRQGRASGAVYDALIAAAALEADARLLSRDERAARTYAAIGVQFELV